MPTKPLSSTLKAIFADHRFRWYGGVLLCLLLLFLAIAFQRALVMVLVLLLLNAATGLLLRPFRGIALGIEVSVLSTVLTSMAYGPKAGIIMGILSFFLKNICQGRVGMISIAIVPSYIIIGALAHSFAGMSLLAVGIGFALFNCIFVSLITTFLFGPRITDFLIFTLSNLPFNFLLFSTIAPVLLRAMA